MPLFFLVAGAAVWFSMKNRTAGGFALERVLRLLVPLIFGMLIIVPPQVYLQRIFNGDFTGSFLAWYPHTFQGTYSMDNPASGNLSWHHLWFLVYLFVFSLLLLPVFRYFRREDKKPLISRIAGFLVKPGMIFLPAILLIVYDVTLRPIYGYGTQNLIADWANFLFYITVFFYGFLMVADNRILEAIHRHRFTAIIATVICIIIIYLVDSETLNSPWIQANGDRVLLPVRSIATWCSLVAIVGFGRQLLNFGNRLLTYASDAVLPVYILHQTLIITIGFYVVQWQAPVAAKYPLVVIATFIGSLAIYELVRRNFITRFLFGIKMKKPPMQQTATGRSGA
jgi:glucans biosynthesis protein C